MPQVCRVLFSTHQSNTKEKKEWKKKPKTERNKDDRNEDDDEKMGEKWGKKANKKQLEKWAYNFFSMVNVKLQHKMYIWNVQKEEGKLNKYNAVK